MLIYSKHVIIIYYTFFKVKSYFTNFYLAFIILDYLI